MSTYNSVHDELTSTYRGKVSRERHNNQAKYLSTDTTSHWNLPMSLWMVRDSQCVAVGDILVWQIKGLCLFTESKLPGEEDRLVMYNRTSASVGFALISSTDFQYDLKSYWASLCLSLLLGEKGRSIYTFTRSIYVMIPLHTPANTLRLGDSSCILSFLHVFPISDHSRGLMQTPATTVQPHKDIILKQWIAQAYREGMDSFRG